MQYPLCRATGSGTEDEGPTAVPLWRQNAEREGDALVLIWGGIGHATAQWQHRHAILFRGGLNLLASADSQQVLAAHPLRHDRCLVAAVQCAARFHCYVAVLGQGCICQQNFESQHCRCRRITAVPPEHVGGISHCLAVCDRNIELSKVAEDSNALIIRFSSEAQVLHSACRLQRQPGDMHTAACAGDY